MKHTERQGAIILGESFTYLVFRGVDLFLTVGEEESAIPVDLDLDLCSVREGQILRPVLVDFLDRTVREGDLQTAVRIPNFFLAAKTRGKRKRMSVKRYPRRSHSWSCCVEYVKNGGSRI